MDLEVKNRTHFGKQTRRLRREGLIPAELYGHGFRNLHLAVSAKTFAGVYREAGTHTVVTLVTEGGEKIPALIVAAERHPISRALLAIDFHHIRSDEQVRAKVPITFVGEAPAVKAGHLVVTVLAELEVEALPADLPHRFAVNMGGLTNVGESIHVGDLPLPKGVKMHTPPETVVVTIGERRKEEVAAAPSAAAAAEATPAVAEGEAATPPPSEKTPK
ncbi:MAG: 50S ribosomal protein L25 [Candidatus Brennerbacteria bacterium]